MWELVDLSRNVWKIFGFIYINHVLYMYILEVYYICYE